MARTSLTTLTLLTALTLAGCESRPAQTDQDNAAAAEQKAAEERAAAQRERSEEANELERRAADLESRWAEMQTRVQTRGRTATAALREEVAEDVRNARSAVADLRTTTEQNWWERHEQALELTVRDVEADVRRLTKQKPVADPPAEATPAAAGEFAARRDAFVTRLRARVDAMEEQLDKVNARGAVQTEVQDTKARIDKLQDDLDELRGVEADGWWDVSSERVSDYIARVEDSIKRLDDNAAAGATRN